MREFLATPFFVLANICLWCCAFIMQEDYLLVTYIDEESEDDE